MDGERVMRDRAELGGPGFCVRLVRDDQAGGSASRSTSTVIRTSSTGLPNCV